MRGAERGRVGLAVRAVDVVAAVAGAVFVVEAVGVVTLVGAARLEAIVSGGVSNRKMDKSMSRGAR